LGAKSSAKSSGIEAVEFQPHAAIGKILNEAGMFFALPEQDRCHASKLVAKCLASLFGHAAITQSVAAAGLAKATSDPPLRIG
jgi:hypothetical protein